MSDKISKALARLTVQEKDLVKHLFLLIKLNELAGLDIKKLKGHRDVYRLRKGKIRIIYRQQNGLTDILLVDHRNEKTYKDF